MTYEVSLRPRQSNVVVLVFLCSGCAGYSVFGLDAISDYCQTCGAPKLEHVSTVASDIMLRRLLNGDDKAMSDLRGDA